MIVVSDATPLINLQAIGLLDLLPKLFQEIVIPPAVYHEVVIKGAGKPGSDVVKTAEWIQVISCQKTDLLHKLKNTIDPGEAEAITLVLELGADLLLIDETLGRKVAKSFQIEIVGVLGILVRAKKKGLISNIKDPVEDLIQKARFYIHPELKKEILNLAGEQ